MPYAPTVNDRSGEILGGYTANAAQLRAQAMANMGQSIGEGLQSIGSSIAGGIAKSQANTAKLQGIQATGEAMQAILPQYGKEGMALGKALQSELGKAGNNPDKMAGTLMAFMPAMENLQSRHNQNNQYTQALNLARQKAVLSNGGGTSNPNVSVEIPEAVDIWQ